MDEMIYNASIAYYNALEKLGYMSYMDSAKLLILSFYRDFTLKDYRGVIKKKDYYLIDKVLDCLYGSTCLIPYPDYLKMGKLHLGEIEEIRARLNEVENTKVIKEKDNIQDISDIDLN